MIRLFCVLILMMSTVSAIGQSCLSIDLRHTAGGRALGEVRNQGATTWCASFVTADLVSYKQRQKISGLGVAIHWTNRNVDWTTRVERILSGTVPVLEPAGSNSRLVLNSIRGRFQCLERDLPSNDNDANSLRGTLERIAQVKRDFDRTQKCPAPSLQTVKSMFPRLTSPEIINILKISAIQDVHKNLLYRNCRQNYVSVMSTELTLSKKWSDMDAQLTRGNLVAFAYNPNVLKNARDTSNRRTHSSTIVGRRMRAGKCEYLIRNSWGRSCGYYDRSYPCEQGNVWVPKENLSRSGNDFFYYP